MKKILGTIILGSFFTTSLFAYNFNFDTYNNKNRFYNAINYKVKNCNYTFGEVQNELSLKEGSDKGESLNGGSYRRTIIEKDGGGGLERSMTKGEVKSNIKRFICDLGDQEDLIKKTTIAIFYRINKATWKVQEVRTLDDNEKTAIRINAYLYALRNNNIDLSLDGFEYMLTDGYEVIKGEKTEDSDLFVKAIVSGQKEKAINILKTSKTINDAYNLLNKLENGEY